MVSLRMPLIVFLLLAGTVAAQDEVIDFETLPDGGIDGNTSSDTPADGVDEGCLFLTDDNVHNFGLAFDNFSPSSIPHFPVCDAGGPYFANAGTPITFDGSGSSDSDGDIVSWHWDFGDGESADGVSPTHTYADDGNYTVVLTVTDNDGNETSCSPDDVVATETQNWDALKALYK